MSTWASPIFLQAIYSDTTFVRQRLWERIANTYIAEGKLAYRMSSLSICCLTGYRKKIAAKVASFRWISSNKLSQAEAFEARLGLSCRVAAIHLCIDDAPLIERIIGRLAC